MARRLLSSRGDAGSVVETRRLSYPSDIWDLSSLTRDQTLSPALEGRFLTTGSPGKSPFEAFLLLLNLDSC